MDLERWTESNTLYKEMQNFLQFWRGGRKEEGVPAKQRVAWANRARGIGTQPLLTEMGGPTIEFTPNIPNLIHYVLDFNSSP